MTRILWALSVSLLLGEWSQSGNTHSSSAFQVSFFQTTRVNRKGTRLAAKTKKDDALFLVQDVFSEELAEQIAAEVAERVNLPFVPSPIVIFVLTQALQNMSSDLSTDTLSRLQEFLEASNTENKYDDLTTEEVTDLASRIGKELNPTVDVPVLDEAQEEAVLQQILQVVLEVVAHRKSGTSWLTNPTTAVAVSQELLGSDQDRLTLVAAMNAAVDVPFLDEGQEEALLKKAVDSCAGTLSALLPPSLLSQLRGESNEGVMALKTFVIDQVCAKVKLDQYFSPEKERLFVETMVDLLIDQYVQETDVGVLLLEKEEQEQVLMEKQVLLVREQAQSRRRFDREQAALALQLSRIEKRLSDIQKSKSLWRRLMGGGKKLQ